MRFDSIKKFFSLAAMSSALLLAPGSTFAEGVEPDTDPAVARFQSAVDSIFSQSCKDGLRVGTKF